MYFWLSGRHLIGNVTTINANISKGLNRISGIITYAPATKQDIPYGEKFISEYISGNAYDCVRLIAGNAPNVTALFHNASIEGNPQLSSALAGINITLPVPGIRQSPTTFKSDESRDDSPFLRSATIHILTRTAQFELFNPLNNSGIIINSLVANATYDDVLVGSITEPLFNFPVLAGCEGYTMTEKVPVEVGSVGYDIIRRALGGQLVVDAVADVVATIGKWRGQIQYEGRGLGANVRL